MKFATAALIAALAATVSSAKDSRTFAVLRFTGKQLTKGRMDPIVSPGKPSAHVHTIMGGSGFSMSATGEDLMTSKCSNAMIKGDNSAYWFPSLYFKDPKNGSLEAVEVFYVNAYYFFEATDDDIKAFPVGLQMVSGDATRRTAPASAGRTNLNPADGAVNAVKFTCPRSNFDPPSWPADSDGSMAGVGDRNNKGEGDGFPFAQCDGYASPLRADIHFPSCYNPDAGLTDYKNNMAFPESVNGKQNCPEGWIHVPHLFLEVYWNTPAFDDRWTPFEGSQPFVLANGDATGYGSHADFMAAWDENLLQHIIDTCDAGSSGMDKCPGLFYGLNEDKCTIESEVNEQVDGVMDALPGNNPITGWQYGAGSGGGSSPAPEEPSKSPSPSPSSSSSASASASQPAVQLPSELPDVIENPVLPPTTSAAQDPVATEQPSEGEEEVPIEAPVDAPTPSSSKPCAPRVHTVWETVTVTAGMPAPTGSDPYAKAKREHVRRHRHRHL